MDLECHAIEIFLELSTLHGAKKPNSEIVRMLLDTNTKAWVRYASWDFSKNLLGKSSLHAVLDLIQLNSALRHIDLSNNQLDTDDVKAILEAVASHQHIESITLGNSHMSVVSARAIHQFVQNNPQIINVDLTGTGIETGEWMPRINRELKLNEKRKVERVVPPRRPHEWLVKTIVFAANDNPSEDPDTTVRENDEAPGDKIEEKRDSGVVSAAQHALAQLNNIGMELCHASALLTRWDLTAATSGEAMVVVLSNPDNNNSPDAPTGLISQDLKNYIGERCRVNPSAPVLIYFPSKTNLNVASLGFQSYSNIFYFNYKDPDHLVLRLQTDVWCWVFDNLYVDPDDYTTNNVMWRRAMSHRTLLEANEVVMDATSNNTAIVSRSREVSEIVSYCVNTGSITVPLVVFGESGLGCRSVLCMAAHELMNRDPARTPSAESSPTPKLHDASAPHIRIVPYFFRSGSDTSTAASFVFDVLYALLGPELFTTMLSRTSDGDLTTVLYETLRNWPEGSTTTVLLVAGWDLIDPVRTDIHKYFVTAWLPDVLPANLRVVISFNTTDRSLQFLRGRMPLPLELRVRSLQPKQQVLLLERALSTRYDIPLPESFRKSLEEPGHFEQQEGIISAPTSAPRMYTTRHDSHLSLFAAVSASYAFLSHTMNNVPVEAALSGIPGTIDEIVADIVRMTEQRFTASLVRSVCGALLAMDGNDATVFEFVSVLYSSTSVPLDVIGSLVSHLHFMGLIRWTAEATLIWQHHVIKTAVANYLQLSEDELDATTMSFAVYYLTAVKATSIQKNAQIRSLLRAPHSLIRGRQVEQALTFISDMKHLQQTIDQGQLWNFLNVVWSLAREFEYLKEIGIDTFVSHQFCRNHKTESLREMFTSLAHSCMEIASGTSLMQLALQMPRASLLGKSAARCLSPSRQASPDGILLDWVNRENEDNVSLKTWHLGNTAVHCDVSKDASLVVVTTATKAVVFSIATTDIVCDLELTATLLGCEMIGTHFIPQGPETPDRAVSFSAIAFVIWNCHTGIVIRNFEGLTLSLRRQCISTSGKRLVAAHVDEPHAVLVDLEELKVLSEFPPMQDEDTIREVHFSIYVDAVLAISTYEAQVHRQGHPAVSLQHDELITRACISNDAIFVATACRCTIFLWRTATGVLLYRMSQHVVAVNDIVFHPSGQVLLSSSHDGVINVWSSTNGEVVRDFTAGNRRGSDLPLDPQFVSYTPDGMRVVARCDNVLRIWDSTSWTDLGVCSGHSNDISFVGMNGNIVASCDVGGTVKVWSTVSSFVSYMAYTERHFVTTNDVMVHTPAHSEAIRSICIVPSGFMATTSDDGKKMSLWGMNSRMKPRSAPNSSPSVRQRSAGEVPSSDSKPPVSSPTTAHPVIIQNIDKIFVPAHSENKWLYATTTGASEMLCFDGVNPSPCKSLRLLDGKKLHDVDSILHVTQYEDLMLAFVLHSKSWGSNRIVIFDLQTEEMKTQLVGHRHDVTGLHFVNREILISTSRDATVRVWGAMTYTEKREMKCADPIRCFAAAHGRMLVATERSDTIQSLEVHFDPTTGTFQDVAFGNKLMLSDLVRPTLSESMTIEKREYSIETINIVHPWMCAVIAGGMVHLIQITDVAQNNNNTLQKSNGHTLSPSQGYISLRYLSALRIPYGIPTCIGSGIDEHDVVWMSVGDELGHCMMYNIRRVKEDEGVSPSRHLD